MAPISAQRITEKYLLIPEIKLTSLQHGNFTF